MSKEQRLVDVNAIPESATTLSTDGRLYIAWSEIIKAPTVDALEVVHAHWINVTSCGRGNVVGFCSNCKTSQEACNHSALRLSHKYCRWCGAKMDGDPK